MKYTPSIIMSESMIASPLCRTNDPRMCMPIDDTDPEIAARLLWESENGMIPAKKQRTTFLTTIGNRLVAVFGRKKHSARISSVPTASASGKVSAAALIAAMFHTM